MFIVYDSNSLTTVLTVYQKLKALLCLLCCMIILMPQGWCCWLVPMQCCGHDAIPSTCCHTRSQVAESCCNGCAESPEAQNSQENTGSIPETCSKCVYDTIRPVTEKSMDWFDIPVTILPVESTAGLPCSLQTVSHEVHTISPPLHVHLCVWRC